MAETLILKAVEFSKLPVKFKKQYKDEQALFAAGWWLQPKYDGCYAEIRVDARPGKPVARAFTRTNEPIFSCQHIIDELVSLTPAGENCVYVGELWDHNPDVKFPEISGWVRRHYQSPELQFMCFDLLPAGKETTELYYLRHERLQSRLTGYGPTCIYTVPANLRNVTSVSDAALTLKSTGKYDGAILRDPLAGYKVGLVKNGEIVKVKPVLSLDLQVVGHEVRYGQKTGRDVHVLAVEYKGVVTQVGSGVPHNFDGECATSLIVEVECMGLTEDGKLREPRFKGIRFDKDKPD